MKKSKFYRNVIEDISDNIEANPVLERVKNFTLIEKAEEKLMKDFFNVTWNLLKPELTENVDLPLIVSRDPVSCMQLLSFQYSLTCVEWSLRTAATSILQPLSSNSKWQTPYFKHL